MFYKKLFLKISQNLQGKIPVAEYLFQWRILLKRHLAHAFSCKVGKIFKNMLFTGHLRATFYKNAEVLDTYLREKIIFVSIASTFSVYSTAWKVSKYGAFSGPYLDTFHAVFFIEKYCLFGYFSSIRFSSMKSCFQEKLWISMTLFLIYVPIFFQVQLSTEAIRHG